MAVRVDLWVPSFGGTPVVIQYILTSGSLHDIITEQLPNLTSQIEQNLAEFETGDIVLSARNDDGWWDSTAFTSSTLNPTARFPLCLYVNVFVAGSLVFQGDVDVKSVSFDRKVKTVSFTSLGPLHRLEQWSAETVRRPTPRFSDFGIATSCGTSGSNWYLKDTTKVWYAEDVVNCCLIDGNNTIWTIIGLYGMGTGQGRDGLTINNPIKPPPNWGGTPTTPPPVGSYTIRPMIFATRYDWQSGGAVTSGAGYLNDASKSWATNQWNGYYVFDSAGVAFGPITSNIGQRLNFASGTPDVSPMVYNIRKSNYPNLLESLGPSIATLGIAGQTLTDQGDVLNLTAANGPIVREGFGWVGGIYVAATQEVVVQFAGPKTSDPALTDHQVWLASAIEQDLYPSDGAIMATPYFRDKTVAQLAALLFLACGSAVQASVVNVLAFSDDIVRYADFEGKSVADALTELAMISNCTLSSQFTGNTATPMVTFNFQRRDAGLGSVLDLSAAGLILERADSPTWEQYYPSITVEGANGTKVQKGSVRPGASQLQVQSDYMNTYAWEHQVLDRLWDFFGKRRAQSAVKVKAEALPVGTAGTLGVSDDFEGNAIGAFPAGWTASYGTPSHWTVQQPGFSWDTTKLLRCLNPGSGADVIQNDAIGWAASDFDVTLAFQSDAPNTGPITIAVRYNAAWTDGLYMYIVPNVNGGAEDSISIWKLVADVAHQLAAVHYTIVTGSPYFVRVCAIGDLFQAKIWPATSSEPGQWNLSASGVPITTGGVLIAVEALASQGYTDWFDHFNNATAIPGTPGAGLLSRVSLSGTDEWWITRLSRVLREPSVDVDLDVVSAAGVEYTPDDFATIDASAVPEPPLVTGVTPSGGNRHVALSWPFVALQAFLGFQRTVWRSIDARPETPTIFVSIGGSLTVVAGSPPTFDDLVTALFLSSPGPWYIDYQAVLIDGRVSQPGPAYLFS